MRGAEGLEERTPLELNSYADDDPEVMTGAVPEQELPMSELLQLDFVDTLMLAGHLPLKDIYKQHLARTRGRSFS